MPSTVKRQSAAVMFTDIAGYTSIMARDEEKALSLLQDKRTILKPLIKQHNGVYVKGTGDGTLSYFDSAYNASKCAKLFQESIYDNKNMNVRVGIHVGDIVFDDGDVYGDGVNVASRLESMSPVGGICVSNTVYDELRNKKEFDGVELGLQSLKGVGRLIEIYGLKGDFLTEPKPGDYQDNKVAVHSDDEVPSIAIIPLKNKGDDKDIFYAYGISTDLITDCSGAGLIRVESLDRIEKIENYDKLDITALASKLFVRYVATGTLWKMDDIFQLSIELYDTKKSKIVWSDRWEENWDNLPSIKGNLSDGLLKALDTTSKVEKKVDTTNPEAYEFYLKGKHKYNTRESADDMEIARGLLNKAIELDDTLIMAKVKLGWIYIDSGDHNKAMQIFIPALKKAEAIGDKRGMAFVINAIGVVHHDKGDCDKAMDYYNHSLKIGREIGDKLRIAGSINNIGHIYFTKGDYDKAFAYMERARKNFDEISKKYIPPYGWLYYFKGDYDIALEYFIKTLKAQEDIGNKYEVGDALCGIGAIYFDKEQYKKAEEYLEKSLAIFKEIGKRTSLFDCIVTLFLCYKKIGKKYNVSEIHTLIKRQTKIEYFINYSLYQLLEDTSYLETSYSQIQEMADNLEPDVKTKFLSYPIPLAIVEEWEKVK